MIGNVYLTDSDLDRLVTVLRHDKNEKGNVIVYSLRHRRNYSIPVKSIIKLMIPIEDEKAIQTIARRVKNIYSSMDVSLNAFLKSIGINLRTNQCRDFFNFETVNAKLVDRLSRRYGIPIEEIICTYLPSKYDEKK